MVEIIKRGELPGEKVYTTTCTHCKTQFKFKQKEARLSSDQRDGDAMRIRCPLEGCNTECWVTPKRYEPRDYDGWYPGR